MSATASGSKYRASARSLARSRWRAAGTKAIAEVSRRVDPCEPPPWLRPAAAEPNPFERERKEERSRVRMRIALSATSNRAHGVGARAVWALPRNAEARDP